MPLAALKKLRWSSPPKPVHLPLPETPRQWLEALQFYDAAEGIDAFLDRFHFGDAGPHQIYGGVLGRLPESRLVAVRPPDYSARRHCRDVLLSDEFRQDMMARTLHANAEKRRVIFVHVPKCAGSDLASHLVARMPHLQAADQVSSHLVPDVLSHLKQLSARIAQTDQIASIGHISLESLLSRNLLRYGDECFAIVRDPVEMALSNVNFILTTLFSDTARRMPDISAWIERMDLHRAPQELDAAGLKQLALRYLHDPALTPPSTLCRYLGHGTAESAFELCAKADIELTSVGRYDDWLRQRWGIVTTKRINVSTRFLRREDLGSADLDYLQALTAEDRILYDRIDQRLRERDAPSIPGSAL